VDYHFIDYLEFLKLHEAKKLAEYVEYNGNYYGIKIEDCRDDTIVTVEPRGLKQLLTNKDLDITVIYLYAPDENRAMNMLKRGDPFDNVASRILKDREHFRGVNILADHIIESITIVDLHKALLLIKNIMGGVQ
jgi:guanylate kinase